MKSLLKLFPALAVALALAGNAFAAPITGTITMSGGVTLDSTHLSTATKASSFTGVVVNPTPSGTFTGTAGSSVSYSPFTFDPVTVPVSPLWTFTWGTNTYEFDLTSMTVVTKNDSDLILKGTGMLMATGYADTPGTWRFSIPDASDGSSGLFDFSFSSSDHALPDGGTTAMLLGLGLTGLAMLARWRKIA